MAADGGAADRRLLFSFSFVEFKSRQHHGGCSFCRLAIWPFFTATKNCSALCGMLAGPALVWASAEKKLPQTSNTVSKTCCQQRRPLKSKASGHCSGDLLNNFSFSVKCARHILQLIVDWLSFSDTQTHMKKKNEKKQKKQKQTGRQADTCPDTHKHSHKQTEKALKKLYCKEKTNARQQTPNDFEYSQTPLSKTFFVLIFENVFETYKRKIIWICSFTSEKEGKEKEERKKMSKKQRKKDHCVTSTHLLVLRQLKSCRLLLFSPPLPPPPPPSFLVNKKNLIIRGNIQCRTAVCLARLDYFTFSLSTIVGS